MAKRKTPKTDKQKGMVDVTIDGVNITVPVLVKKLLDDQRAVVQYYEHLTCLWYYKEFDEETSSSFEKELAAWFKDNTPGFEERIENFKKVDEEKNENLEDDKVN
tara:strand:+ start:1229 stop:1543 length:315 start_codon:yes stop_codon:yes gene_type:complete